MSGVLDRPVEGVVDHELVFVRVAKEDAGNDMRRVAGDNLVEVIAGVGKRVRAVPAGQDVAEDPHAFAFIFGILEFADHPSQIAGIVRISGVDIVEKV